MKNLSQWLRVLLIVFGILTAAALVPPFRGLAQQDLSKPILSPEQQKERDLLPDRQKLMKQAKQKATLVIFSTRVQGQQTDPDSAANLVEMINNSGLFNAMDARQCVLLKASQADPNEQKTLWDLAREFQDYTEKNSPTTDYALYADYVFNPQNWEQGFVHFIICDRKGELVIVDFQNSHQPDYQSVKPTSREGCDNLLVKRLESYLR